MYRVKTFRFRKLGTSCAVGQNFKKIVHLEEIWGMGQKFKLEIESQNLSYY